MWAGAYTNVPPYSATHDVTLTNSIVSQNVDGTTTAPDIYDYGVAAGGRGTPYITGTFNFIRNNAGSGFVAGNPGPGGNKVGTPVAPLNAMLDALANNGGQTMTHLPMAGSPVIDMGDPATMGGTDQRGLNRVVNGRVDIGSVEVQPAGINLDFNNDGQYNCGDMGLLEAAIDAGNPVSTFDVNGDGMLTSADVFAWLMDAGEIRFGAGRFFRAGDATLDGTVDGSDFGVWNAKKFTTANRWCLGDFNQDNAVDGSDFGIWNANKFTSSDASRPVFGGGGLTVASHRDLPATRAARQALAPIGREVAERTPSVAPTSIRDGAGCQEPLAAARQIETTYDGVVQRPTEMTILPSFQSRVTGWQGPMRHEETSASSAIDRVFAELQDPVLTSGPLAR
jgi:hypothetical protein